MESTSPSQLSVRFGRFLTSECCRLHTPLIYLRLSGSGMRGGHGRLSLSLIKAAMDGGRDVGPPSLPLRLKRSLPGKFRRSLVQAGMPQSTAGADLAELVGRWSRSIHAKRCACDRVTFRTPHLMVSRRTIRVPDDGGWRRIGNGSVPIQLAQCWFPGLAISSAKAHTCLTALCPGLPG